MDRSLQGASIEAANTMARAIIEMKMGQGYHTFWQRLKDSVTVAGCEPGLDCVLFGHAWYPNSLMEDGRYVCYCHDCGAGSYFDEVPAEAYEFRFDCRDCDGVFGADEILPHTVEQHNYAYEVLDHLNMGKKQFSNRIRNGENDE